MPSTFPLLRHQVATGPGTGSGGGSGFPNPDPLLQHQLAIGPGATAADRGSQTPTIFSNIRWRSDPVKRRRIGVPKPRPSSPISGGDWTRHSISVDICVLRNSVKDKKKVFEMSGKHKFKTEGSYSFLFMDYGCTVEFFRSPFLVQEWEMPGNNGTKKETLCLDLVKKSASKYKDAHVIIFNTGHWWTHEKTSKGKDYYQEGYKIYDELDVADVFHKALHTWAKWIDANVNPKKSLVFFMGYSASHLK